MAATRNPESAASTTTGIAAVLTAGGVLTFALFPLAIPFLVLTVVFTAPLLVLALVPALALAIIAGAALAIRATWRRLGRRGTVEGGAARANELTGTATRTRTRESAPPTRAPARRMIG